MKNRLAIGGLLQKRFKMRILTVFALLIVTVFLGQLILFQGGKSAKAIGESEDNPYVINTSGFIWYQNGHSYFVRNGISCVVRYIGVGAAGAMTSGFIVDTDYNGTNGVLGVDRNCYLNRANGINSAAYNDAVQNPMVTEETGRYVQITTNNTVVAMWGGPHQLAGLSVMTGTVVTHAPLVWFNNMSNIDYGSRTATYLEFDGMAGNTGSSAFNAAAFTPGYSIMNPSSEHDFDATTGVLTDSGVLKKVEIVAPIIRVLGGKIDATGRGYPGAPGYNTVTDNLVTNIRTNGNNNDNNTPIGLPYNYGGRAGQVYGNNNCTPAGYASATAMGGGGNGYSNFGGRSVSVQYINPTCNAYVGTSAAQPVTSLNLTSQNLVYGANLNYGAGGGGGGRYNNVVNRGGSGGGYVHLNATLIEMTTLGIVRSNGQYAINGAGNNWGGGGGAGGVVRINDTTANGMIDVTNLNSSSVSNLVPGGNYNVAGNNLGIGAVIFNGVTYASGTVNRFYSNGNLSSNGGYGEVGGNAAYTGYTAVRGAGGGGGGLIELSGTFRGSCTIRTTGATIPSYCDETRDVIIDGAGTAGISVDIGGARVWQTDGTHSECAPTSGLYAFDGVRESDKKCRYYFLFMYKYEDPLVVNHSAGWSCDSVITPGKVADNTVYPDCDSKRHFNSLTVKGSATLMHAPVLVADMAQDSNHNRSLGDESIGTARWKKVDVETVANLTLQSGGQINVNGKGYPGGATVNENGYGPGFGGYATYQGNSDRTASSGGGGFGGHGGTGVGDVVGIGGVVYANDYTLDPMTIDFGSGAGYAYSENRGGGSCGTETAQSAGGAGGGRIMLDIHGTIIISSPASVITANGINGTEAHSSGSWPCAGVDAYSRSGAGSGGSIYVRFINIQLPAGSTIVSSVNGGASGGANNPDGVIQNNIVGIILNFVANGGIGGSNEGGGGGGGRIVLRMAAQATISVKKVLEAVDRPNAVDDATNPNGTHDGFNPYALQMGDRIKVVLTLTNLFGFADLRDDLLATHVAPVSRCSSVDNSDNVISGNYANFDRTNVDYVVFQGVTPDAAGTAEVSYDCIVQ